MILIGENIHIISKSVRSALENRDENFVKNLIKIQEKTDALDLNVGPAMGKLDRIFEWLCPLVGNKPISFDSSNIEAVKTGLKICGNSECFINSTTADNETLDILSDLALEYDCNLIALTMTKENGIPNTSDERFELAYKIFDICMQKGLPADKIFLDPLVLPIKISQSQANEIINTIKAIKEGIDADIKTVIGLSNISNGAPSCLRPLINRVFGVLCFGAGLDSAIADARDSELIRIFKMLENNKPENNNDVLYLRLADMIRNFDELENVDYDKSDSCQYEIMKTAAVLLNKNVYSDSFTQI